MSLNLYRWYVDFFRQGKIEGLFVAEPQDIENAIGKRYDLGEALGKHSWVYGTLQKEEITLVSENPIVVSELINASKFSNTICGCNPLDYVQEECSQCQEWFDPDDLQIGLCWMCYDELENNNEEED